MNIIFSWEHTNKIRSHPLSVHQAGLPSVEECLQKAQQFCDENKFIDAMKYYLVSSSPELALDIGLNLVRGMVVERIFLKSLKNDKRIGVTCVLQLLRQE